MKTAILDVKGFMHASDQLVHPNPALYLKLIAEEYTELLDAIEADDEVEAFDAVLDLIWVVIGYGLSRRFPLAEGWNEVANSNHAKIDPETGRVLKRPDGKVQKPEGWAPPNLKEILERYGNT